ncbi:hypothetical protein J6590_018520 [Homalodisca vitripennis]|nr:hypothetical protein J6590_018520 [Homalodisca vitripennis]
MSKYIKKAGCSRHSYGLIQESKSYNLRELQDHLFGQSHIPLPLDCVEDNLTVSDNRTVSSAEEFNLTSAENFSMVFENPPPLPRYGAPNNGVCVCTEELSEEFSQMTAKLWFRSPLQHLIWGPTA